MPDESGVTAIRLGQLPGSVDESDSSDEFEETDGDDDSDERDSGYESSTQSSTCYTGHVVGECEECGETRPIERFRTHSVHEGWCTECAEQQHV